MPSFSRMLLTAASDFAQPLRVFLVGSYFSGPRPNICWDTRIEFPVGGGGPKTPSLSSSDMVKVVSQDFQCRIISFFSRPNQVFGPGASATWARMVPSPGGKYSCSRENRSYSGSEPSSQSQQAATGP